MEKGDNKIKRQSDGEINRWKNRVIETQLEIERLRLRER
jgi:hypothetical protein